MRSGSVAIESDLNDKPSRNFRTEQSIQKANQNIGEGQKRVLKIYLNQNESMKKHLKKTSDLTFPKVRNRGNMNMRSNSTMERPTE